MKRPEAPQGYTEGASTPSSRVQDGSETIRPDGFRKGLFWSAVAGVCMILSVPVGCIIGSYGLTCCQSEGKGSRGRLTAFAVMLAVIVAADFALGAGFIADAVVGSLVSLVVSSCYKDGIQAGPLFAIIAGATLALVAAESWYASANETTITAVIDSVVSEYLESVETQSQLGSGAQMSAVREWMDTYWPLAFVTTAALEVFFSLTGIKLALRKMGEKVVNRGLVTYDLPVWVACLFVLGVVAVLAGSYSPVQPELVVRVGENVLLVTRFAFFLQGLGIALWFAVKRRFSPALGLAMVVLLAWIEVHFFLVSVLGLVDLAANFRGMPRFGSKDMRGQQE